MSQFTPFVVASCASKVHRASARGKPFKKGRAVPNPLVSLFYLFVARGGRKYGNQRTDRHTDRPSTVILAAHARLGLIRSKSSLEMGSSGQLFRACWPSSADHNFSLWHHGFIKAQLSAALVVLN